MIISSIINILSPSQCLICNKEGQSICDECWHMNTSIRKSACFLCNSLVENGKTCKRCNHKTNIKGVTIPFRLQGVVKESIYEIKYYKNREIAKLLASKIVKSLPDRVFDSITYVPSTGKSQRMRGYNQSKLIATEVSRIIEIKNHEYLLRTKHLDQIGLSREERFSAVNNNFILKKKCAGQNILLVDDVVTTGATIDECARVLKSNGAKSIWALAVAKK